MRLRAASRAVLGIGAAVAAPAAAGLSLEACVIAGLAALLALFTVTDPTVRRQAVTVALLPAVGVPVLTLALALRDAPLLRDAAFLAVAFAGAYARRWGTRGHALGVFGFMMFFAAQFLTTGLSGAPGLHAALLLAVLVVCAVRFGLWCYERRNPPPAVPAPPGGRGLARPATRLAVQTAAACAFALAAGQLLSQERWYWAVGAAWWIFVNTASRGETLVRGFRRVLGTLVGIVAGLWVAVPVDGGPVATGLLLSVCVFGIFYTAAVSYSWMMFFVTVLVGLLYGMLGALHPGLLQLRLIETAVGALGAGLAVAFVLPVTTHAATHGWIRRAVHCVHACARESALRLAGDESADPARRIAELEMLLDRVRTSLAPLVHLLSPLRARRARAREVLALLDDCARQAHGLARVAADPDASHDARLADACRRVEEAVHRLTGPARDACADADGTVTGQDTPCRHPGADRALGHLHGLETALVELAVPVHAPPRAPLTTAA
ncbi:FUSC family protein [Streptomyces sp. DSM 42041]|uniref:FUSC family protein n=1 Tax=Streptomyces hazeniae TaxID=3075538 RepID=A0ABU2NW14_9ACTN|nr:FUSC family protein [Streptomyces sp. DSM 42041]MDT0381176.1 FUSC family protein [Streptomyces sp. DSM 42041]